MPVQLIKTYFLQGPAPKGTRHPYGLDDPPVNGWGHVVKIHGEKRSTLLCPFSLRSYQVGNHFAEVAGAFDVPDYDMLKLGRLIAKNWEEAAAMGLQRDYAVAALVLGELGIPVPRVTQPTAQDGEAKVQGGKPIVHANLRPVRPDSKRGEVASFFVQERPQSIHEAMAKLGLTRSGVLSHLFCLSRDHGVGYVLANDCANLLVPEGFDLFAYVEPERKAREKPADDGRPKEVKKRTSGKPVNVDALAPIPQPGKRAAVAEWFLKWQDIKEVEQKLELNRSAVLSHLFTINKENGLGYELSEDSTQARLIVPEGHAVFCAKQPRPKKEKAAEEA
jgi:hypothetical protein